MINPENRCSFPFDRATLPAKKGAAVSPLNCRVKIPANQPNKENNRFNPYFLLAWTLFLLSQKTPSSVCQKERFTGLFEIRSSLHPLCHVRTSRDYRICGGAHLSGREIPDERPGFYSTSLPSPKKILFLVDSNKPDRKGQVLSRQFIILIQRDR
jgi:hypothetical protein